MIRKLISIITFRSWTNRLHTVALVTKAVAKCQKKTTSNSLEITKTLSADLTM